MKAIVIENFGGLEQVKLADMPVPEPQHNEVQVKVAYAGVNPVDWKISEGYLRERLPHSFPLILGWDVSGTVTKVGDEVKDFKVGDKVFAYARKLVVKWGTFAEFVCIEANNLSKKPSNISMKEAATMPLATLTAWQSIVELVQLKPDQTALIHGGAGGVGSMAIQVVKSCGGKAITTVSSNNQEYVKKMGADTVVDYTQGDFVAKVKEVAPEGVDFVFDSVGGNTLLSSFMVLKKGGSLISIVQAVDATLALKFGVNAGFVFVRPEGTQLRKIAELISEGKILPPKIEEFPLEDAKKALEKLKAGHVCGKLVLKVAGE